MGRYERLAYARQEQDLALAAQPGGHPKGYTYDPEDAERAIRFIEGFCRHFEGEWAGQSLILEEWQRFVFRCVFGWKRADGTRRFRIAYQEVARKNGKSTSAAGIANFLTFGDQEPGAQCYTTATKEEQAKIVWGAARKMVQNSPDLRRFATLRQKAIVCDRLESFLKPLGSDSDTLDGLNPHGHICDELHAHKTRGLWDVMVTAMGARREPLTFVITTAGQYNPESIGWLQHDHAVKVLEGTLEDDEFFAIIFAADVARKEVGPDGVEVEIPADDWTLLSTWQKANPNLGVSVKQSYLESLARTATAQPSFLNTFLRLNLNVWTQQVTRWLSVESWNACDVNCTADDMRERERALLGAECYGGLDLSEKIDLSALALFFPNTNDLLLRFWMPEATILARAQKDRVPYDAWARDGWLIATPGETVDQEFIKAEIERVRNAHDLRELGFDPWGATGLSNWGVAAGVPLVEIRQGPRTLSEPSKELEARIVSRRIRHGGNPVMRWMVSNVAVREDVNANIAPDKPKRSTGLRIDGVVATIMALSRSLVTTDTTSVYEERGLRTL